MNFLEKFLIKQAPRIYSLVEMNNITGLFDDKFLISKKDNLICAIELEGIDYLYLSENEMIEQFKNRVNAFNKLTSSIGMRILAKRRKKLLNKSYENLNNIYADNIIQKWENNREIYKNNYYIILETQSSIKGFLDKKKSDLVTSKKEDEDIKDRLNLTFLDKKNALSMVCKKIIQTLGEFKPKILNSNQTLEIFAEYMNGFPIKLNLKNGLISDSYIASTLEFKKDYYIQEYNGKKIYKKIISLKNYDTETIDSIVISSLLHKDAEFDLILNFETISKTQAERVLDYKRKFTNNFARAKILDLIEQVKAEYVVMQNVSLHIIPFSNSKETLNFISENIATDMLNYGFIPIEETINLIPQYFCFFPDNLKDNPRKRMQSSVNSSSMILFEKEDQGFAFNSWGNTPITIFKTQSLSNYMFNFHAVESKEKVAGHTMIVGGTGSGKTTLISFLMMNCLKFNVDILALDRLYGMRIFTEFFEGEYNTGENFYINPFTLSDEYENKQFLKNWLNMMIGLSENNPEDIAKIKRIENAIALTYRNQELMNDTGFKISLKTIKEAIAIESEINDDNVALQLERYLENPIFNQIEDCLDFNKRITTINMDQLVSNQKDASLVVFYLIHKMIFRGKEFNKNFFMFIDEFRSYTDNEMMNEKINLIITQARKVGGVITLAFQDFNQLSQVPSADSYIKNMANIIIYPDPTINFDSLYQKFGLTFTQTEKNFLLHTQKLERKILIKNLIQNTSSIVNVDLSSLGKYLKIFNSSSDAVSMMKELQKKYATNWRSYFLGERE